MLSKVTAEDNSSISFFSRDAVEVARDLLGARIIVGQKQAIITETEAYCGSKDGACHARFGKTKRAAVLYGPPAMVYVYLCYGMHWMLNFVTGNEGEPAAVLVRAINIDNKKITGPGRVTKYLGISGEDNNCSIGKRIKVIPDIGIDKKIKKGPRVGIDFAPEPWRSKNWRFWV